MASLRIPRLLRKQLLALAQASNNQIHQLQEKLKALRPDLSPADVPERLSSELTTWNKEKATAAVQALMGLAAFRAQSGDEPEEVISEVLEAAKNAEPEDDEPHDKDTQAEEWLAPEEERKLHERLVSLLSTGQLDIAAKALGVLNDNQRSYVIARILSDLRPVFHDNVAQGPAAFVVVHSLKVEFVESRRQQEFFVTLDGRDLQALMRTLQRALEKDRELQTLATKLEIPYLAHKG